MNFIGAGVLPYSFNKKDELVFLLGLEYRLDKNGKKIRFYSDFGGHRENNEMPIKTAYREFEEESMGVLGKKDDIMKLLNNPKKIVKSNNYYEYLIPIEYNMSIIKTYNTLIKHLDRCMISNNKKVKFIPTCPIGLLEKVRLRWFTKNEILKNKKIIRSEFYITFKKLLNELKSLD